MSIVEGQNHHLPVAEIVRTKGRHKYLSDAIGLLVFSENCDADFAGIFGVHDTAVLLDSNLLAAGAFDLEKRKALDSFASASLISSSLNGLKIASIFFITARPAILPQPARSELLIVVLAQLLWRVPFFLA